MTEQERIDIAVLGTKLDNVLLNTGCLPDVCDKVAAHTESIKWIWRALLAVSGGLGTLAGWFVAHITQ